MLKVGVIGCGHISATHLKAWAKTRGSRVHGVFDVSRESAQKRAKQFDIERVYGDIESVIAECDVIDVCTPPQTHTEICKQVIEASRHLVVEKPIVIDVADWDELSGLLEHSPSRVSVAHHMKHTIGVQEAARWISEGKIGQVLRIDMYFMTSGESDRMLTKKHWSHDLPGGRWFETLPHNLYMAHFFAGALELDHVSAIRTARAPQGTPADEVMIALTGEQTICTIHFSANCRVNRRTVTIRGEEGVIEIDLLAQFATLSRLKETKLSRGISRHLMEAGLTVLQSIPDRSSQAISRLRGETPHWRLIDAFDKHLHDQGPAPTPIEEIDYVVRTCDRIGRAIDSAVSVPA